MIQKIYELLQLRGDFHIANNIADLIVLIRVTDASCLAFVVIKRYYFDLLAPKKNSLLCSVLSSVLKLVSAVLFNYAVNAFAYYPHEDI